MFHFENCDLSGLEISEVDLHSAVFRGADLRKVRFFRCNLARAFFHSADCEGTVFLDCDLTGANFCEANCRLASFPDSRLNGALFFKADITDADFVWSDLSDANLQRVTFSKKTKPSKFLHATTNGVVGNDFVRRWISEQAYIASFAEQHPRLAFLWRLSTNYGRSPLRLITCAIAIGLVFAFTYQRFDLLACARGMTPITCLYFSFLALATSPLGDVLPKNMIGEVVVCSEIIIGYVLLGLMVSIIAASVGRR